MEKIKLQSIPAGHDGNGYITVGGKVVTGFRITKISAKVETERASRRFLGERMEQNAARGMKGSGSVSYCHCTTAIIDAMKKYCDGGSYPEITLQYWSESPDLGRCEVVLQNVVLAEVPFGALDDGSDEAIVNESEFSFDGFEVISRFNG